MAAIKPLKNKDNPMALALKGTSANKETIPFLK